MIIITILLILIIIITITIILILIQSSSYHRHLHHRFIIIITLIGVERNLQEALKYYKQSADQGYSTAKSNLVSLYRDGKGLKLNRADSKKYF